MYMQVAQDMAANKNAKDVVLVNCLEVPETICVETRFISPSASRQKKYDQLYYITSNGSLELTKHDDVAKSARSINPSTYAHNLPAKTTATPVPTHQPCQLPQQGQFGNAMLPKANLNRNNKSNVFNNLPAGQNQIPTVTIPLSNTNALQKLNLNSPDFTPTLLGNTNSLNIASVKRTYNEKVQQTDVSLFNSNSVAIQCNLDDELQDVGYDLPAANEESLETLLDSEMEKEILLKFIKDNTVRYKNVWECLICGELCRSNKYLYGHMEIHRGPRVLCHKCGHNLDHKNMLVKHRCRNTRQLEKAFLQCPHHACSVKAISQLELYDHINEHVNNRMYKCSACYKGFCTVQEFLRHLLIRASCYTSVKRKRFRVYGLESQTARSCRVRVFTLHTFKKRTTLVKSFLSKRVAKQGVCKICLKYFFNKSVYNRHRVNCITKFKKRILRKSMHVNGN